MGQGLVLSHSMAMAHKLSLANAQLMSLPFNYIDLAIQNTLDNPELVKEAFNEMQNVSGGAWYNYYGLVAKKISGYSTSNNPPTDGEKRFIGLETLENKAARIIQKPDVEFVAESESVNAMKFMPEFAQKREQSLEQIPKEVQPFYTWLINEKEWIVKTLGASYNFIRKVQAPFIYGLNPERINLLRKADLGEGTGLGYHESTFGRLLTNRTVKITSPNGTIDVIPVEYLFANHGDLLKYKKIPAINSLLEQEAETGNSFSASELCKVGCIARRTVQKYLTLAVIPDCFKREEEYKKGRTTPYKIALEIDPYLPNVKAA